MTVLPETIQAQEYWNQRSIMTGYAHPEVLVTPDWVEDRADDPMVRIVEVDVNTESYEGGHIPNALGWVWSIQLCDTVLRDIITKAQFEALMGIAGIRNPTTAVLYGDSNNRFAAWAFWLMKIYGHGDVRIMNGGRKKWIAEGRNLSLERPRFRDVVYKAKEPDFSIRAFLPEVQETLKQGSAELVDVRSLQEYSGENLTPPGLPEYSQRSGHIPGARNITWTKTCNADGTFKSYSELQALFQKAGVTGSKPIITYCRMGERSSHSWFVMKYLLGYRAVKSYDGSWTEWGNLVGAPIERAAKASVHA